MIHITWSNLAPESQSQEHWFILAWHSSSFDRLIHGNQHNLITWVPWTLLIWHNGWRVILACNSCLMIVQAWAKEHFLLPRFMSVIVYAYDPFLVCNFLDLGFWTTVAWFYKPLEKYLSRSGRSTFALHWNKVVLSFAAGLALNVWHLGSKPVTFRKFRNLQKPPPHHIAALSACHKETLCLHTSIVNIDPQWVQAPSTSPYASLSHLLPTQITPLLPL